MTNEQIEQKKQQLAKKVKEMKAIYDELVEAGVIELGSPLLPLHRIIDNVLNVRC